jgi:hypothetical protein
MKKLLFLFVFVFGLAYVSNAQFGIRAGVNIANQSYSAEGIDISPSSTIGFHFGVVNTFSIGESLSFRPGLLYSMKGSKFEFDFGGVTESATSKFNYLEVPLDFIYGVGNNGIFLSAGPYLGLLLSADSEGEDIKDSAESIDFGLNVGAGYRTGNISVGVQYGLGLSNIAKDAGDGESVKNTNLSIYGIYHL